MALHPQLSLVSLEPRGQCMAEPAVCGSQARAQHMVEQVEATSYEPPKELRLRTAGAHKKKAESLAKDGEHDEVFRHPSERLCC